jgi:hypothetical protein
MSQRSAALGAVHNLYRTGKATRANVAEAMRGLHRLENRIGLTAVRRTLTRFAREGVKRLKTTIRSVGAVRTKAYLKSVGSKVKRTRSKQPFYALVGARRGFVAPEAPKKFVALSRRVRAPQRKGLRKPSRYAHLVERKHHVLARVRPGLGAQAQAALAEECKQGIREVTK